MLISTAHATSARECLRALGRQHRSIFLGAALTCTALVAGAACGARSQIGAGQARASATGGAGGTLLSEGGAEPIGGMDGGGFDGVGGGPVNDCTDPDITYIYVVTSTLEMYAFKPQTTALEFRGSLDCANLNATPFSMAVRRNGLAYVVYGDGSLWQVSVKDASCKPTNYAANQQNYLTFGMGFALDDGAETETLYVADIDYTLGLSKGLARIVLDTFGLDPVAPFMGAPGYRIELTARGPDLSAFIIDSSIGGGYLANVDKQTGAMTDLEPVPLGDNIGSWHFAYWGEQFYFFTTQGAQTTTSVRRYDPVSKSISDVITIPHAVVGAGVSTCDTR